MKYYIEVCCMRYGSAYVEAKTPEEAKEKARELYDRRLINWNDEEIKQMNVERVTRI